MILNILTYGAKMKLSTEEFSKMIELEGMINVIVNLSELLFQYNGEKEFLMDILFEKIKIMENKFDDFTSCLIKKL